MIFTCIVYSLITAEVWKWDALTFQDIINYVSIILDFYHTKIVTVYTFITVYNIKYSDLILLIEKI